MEKRTKPRLGKRRRKSPPLDLDRIAAEAEALWRGQTDPPTLALPVPRMRPKSLQRAEGKRRRLERARRIYDGLAGLYTAETELDHKNPFQLLVATTLSAQTTDKAVNLCTPALFKAYPTPAVLGEAAPTDVEPYINSIGLFRQKAKSIVSASRDLVEHHDGQVPRSLDALTQLRGVGRKTAAVVLGNAFGIHEGIPTDTHVQRLSERLALSTEPDVAKKERELMALYPRQEWGDLSHRLILHGRRVCAARKPACGRCTIAIYCPSRTTGISTAQSG